MALLIGDNFSYNGKKPNFERDSFETLAALKAFAEANLDNGHIAYCVETNKHYIFNDSNSDDTTTGKWRVLESEFSNKVDQSDLTTQLATKEDKFTVGTGLEMTPERVLNVTLDITVFKVVSALPDSPARGDENKIHLVPAESTGTNNAYTEYVWVNSAWEILGEYTSEVDLTPYLKTVDAQSTYATKTELTAHTGNTSNPHNVTAAQVGLGNVDNTSDADKPISTATQEALNLKQNVNDDSLQTTSKTVVGAINEILPKATGVGKSIPGRTGEIFNCYEGSFVNIAGEYAHAEGHNTEASGSRSHAEGETTVASGMFSHAESFETVASGDASHAEGNRNAASGDYSHAEGCLTKASGYSSHTEGYFTQALTDYEHSEGTYNKSYDSTDVTVRVIHSVGIGSDNSDRKNAHEIKFNGDHYVYGLGGYDGTNALSSDSKTLQQVITELQSGQSYQLPIASADTLGGIKVGSGLSINPDTGVLSATGGGTADSVDWANVQSKPQINGHDLVGGNNTLDSLGIQPAGDYALNSEIPTKTSELENDSGFLTSIPSEYITETELETALEDVTFTLPVASSNTLGGIKVGAGLSISGDGILSATGGGVADSVAWENVVGRPTNLSQFTNDSGFITNSALADYALKSEIPDISNLATKTEVATKQDTLVSGTNIKTINGTSLLGEGNIVIEGGGDSEITDVLDNKIYARTRDIETNQGTWVDLTDYLTWGEYD